jgi:hypothetical protein
MGVRGGDERPLHIIRTCQWCSVALASMKKDLPTALLATRDAIAE